MMHHLLLSTLFVSIDPEKLNPTKLDHLLEKIIDLSIGAGRHILMAVAVYFLGRILVRVLNRLFTGVLERRSVDVGVQSFLKSMVNILLMVLLAVAVISALGVNTTSFAALLASGGVAIGMALSGNLQNVAGGLVVLLFKPYRVGDLVESAGIKGVVREIQIFHTIVVTYDNKVIYVPNGTLSTSVIVNHSREDYRRLEWQVGVDYGAEIDPIREKIFALFKTDERIVQDIEGRTPFVGLNELADSSVNLVIRAWVKGEDYWAVYHQMFQQIYEMFNREGINIPFPQRVLHIQHENAEK